ncbi:MAG: hypothetical protein WBL68_05390 [Nitrososphaeraceae archaeon]
MVTTSHGIWNGKKLTPFLLAQLELPYFETTRSEHKYWAPHYASVISVLIFVDADLSILT